ncbi:ubiquitin-like small modifier protein 1 [Methanocalculus sp.]|uniref:ubiquitin-like small modifier protein 1 n=1 Tax=Methanocalculus sp. TaxID=2004547 RepID=UPI00262287A0|nr:ubiquitin-like small modifier protein 1 [Methanocalculus sp.]MDG6249953.1 MoaD/ThiS family protein [Methanocalculus sp.]
MITIKAFARFREVLGSETTREVAEGTTLAALLQEIARKNPKMKASLYDDDGTLRRYIIVMQNKKRVNHSEIESVILNDGDEIALYPPVAGG